MNGHSYCLEFGTIMHKLPLCYYEDGPVNAVRLAYAHGYANKMWPRAEAIRIMFLAHMERAESFGSGNRAARRMRAIKARATRHYHDLPLGRPRE